MTMHAQTPAGAASPDRVKPKIALRAQPFALSQVRLLEGPFLRAQELDRAYLRSLDPDSLLHAFRLNTGLPTTAQPLGGWEKPDSEVRGHFVGHYLSACARMVALTGDETLKKNADRVVAGMAECQQALGSGYLSAYPESFMDRVEALQPVWAPWYTLHKIYAGLQDMNVYAGNRQALDVARRFAAWAKKRMDRLSDAQMQKMLGNEHGGINETLANLYALTGDPDDLALSLRFNHHALLDPLARNEDILTGLHANTQIPKFVGAARQYELTGDPVLRDAALNFWRVVARERSYVIGGHSDGEMFSPKERLSEAFGPSTTETCNTYNMLKLTRHLLTWEPKAEYGDFYERALYNHILASQNPESGMMCYYVPLRPASRKEYNTPLDSFWCCTGTGIENHARYGDAIYFHDGGDGLFVNLFLASTLDWSEKGVTVRQETGFPDEAATRLAFTCAKPVRLTLRVRHPGWAGPGFRVRVNGEQTAAAGAPGDWAEVTRTWRTGDTVEVTLPMTLRTEGFRDNPRRFAFLYGPIVLSAPTGSQGGFPAFVTEDPGRLPAAFAPVPDRPLAFRGDLPARRIGESEGVRVTLTPFFRMYDRSYDVYWDALAPAEWEAKETAYRAEEARRRALEARTVDSVQPNDAASEQAHALAGERTGSGDFGGHGWRHATDGGWFAYTLKVEPETAQELVCTYWGSDVGGRVFDILVDGVKIATQTLERNRPDVLYEETYPLPPDLLKGKTHLTVRFQAHPGRFAGGVFGCRVLRK